MPVSFIVMDAPPPQEDVRPFITIASLIQGTGLNAPRVLEQDVQHGFLLLTDLGSQLYLSALQDAVAREDSALRESLMRDATISDILINGPKMVFVERQGRLEQSSVTFQDEAHLLRIIRRIVGRVGRHVDESTPMVDARLLDGSRVNAVISPIALDGPMLTIRKFSRDPYQAEDLVNFGTITNEAVGFLKACVMARANLLISGGTGTGKTTLLNVCSSFIPPDERIVTIEDAAELQLHQEHVCRMETRPPDLNGENKVAIHDLVINALRMRPDLIVVGVGVLALFLLTAFSPNQLIGNFTVFVLAIVIGYYVIGKVHHALHTPLMSITNAISGIIVVGALLQIGHRDTVITVVSFVAILLASINIFGGFAVTRRMLSMFSKG